MAQRGFSRLDRIADQMQRELAFLLQREVKDPRVGMATINKVKVSKDLTYADVYVTFMTVEGKEAEEPTDVLNDMAGYLRTMLAKAMKLRHVPHLRFHYDEVLARGRRVSNLINEAVREDKARHQQDNADDVAADSAEDADTPET